jgi:3-methyladenine DNA glycosylase AlkD
MEKILHSIRAELLSNANEKDRISGQRFFKEEVKLLGIKTAVVTAIGKKHFNNLPDKSKSFVFQICDELLKSGIMEECFIACEWSYFVHKEYVPEDIEVFGKWVNTYVNNWAVCDTLCNHSAGELVEMYPRLIKRLRKWAGAPNRWMKRASAVTLIIPARKGLFLNDIFEIAGILLMDKDDMVQKGYGWMLKAASQAHQNEVFDFVMKHRSVMPRTALRYAIEKMPAEMKKEAMGR